MVEKLTIDDNAMGVILHLLLLLAHGYLEREICKDLKPSDNWW